MVIIGDSYVRNLVSAQDGQCIIVGDEDEAIHYFRLQAPEIVIFDLTHFQDIGFKEIRQSTMTVSLSPIFDHLGEIDLLFHRTEVIDGNGFDNCSRPIIKRGLQYAIIGEHCHRIDESVYRENLACGALSLAIGMGGTDAANKTLCVLDTIKQLREKLILWVLLGEGYEHSYQDLVDCMRGSRHEIILAKTNDSMWSILSRCSVAILAGGTTTYEAAFAGLPSINALETSQRYFLIQELVEKGVCLCAGRTFDESLTLLCDLISHVNESRQELLGMHLRSRGLIDGKGVQRIVREIEDYYWHSYRACQRSLLDPG